MRRRAVIAGAGSAMLATQAGAAESTRIPADLPDGTQAIAEFADLPGKRRLLRLTGRPPNYASPIDVFTEAVTPNDRFYIRYHLPGVPSDGDMDNWSLSIGGDAVTHPNRLKLSDLLDMPSNEVLAVCQSAGNRRGFIDPHVAGVQWTDGGMGCAVWRGPALRDVLKAAGVTSGALEVWFGGNAEPPGVATPPYRKSLPMDKAMDGDTIVAIAMNNAPLPLLNGYPARLVVPGWAGDYWMKHLTAIEVSQSPLNTVWMREVCRVPSGLFAAERPFPSQAAGTTVPVTGLPVNSVIAEPLDGDEVTRYGFDIKGVAWDRGAGINRVEVSLDGGRTWQDALLDRPLGPYAYRRFILQTGPLHPGPFRLLSRATSLTGDKQPVRFKANPGGYNNNVPHPISVTVT